MTVRLSALRITSDYDASGFVAGANAQAAASDKLVAASRAVGAAFAQQDAAREKLIPGQARLSAQFITGYAEAAKFEAAIRRVGNALDRGMDADLATRQLQGIYEKYGLIANAGDLAARGYVKLAPLVTDLNARLATQAETATRAAAATRQFAEAQQYQQQINQRLGVNDNFGGAARAADVAAYGKALDDLRAKFNPLFAAGRDYKATLQEINQAARVGAISEVERAAAIARTKDAFAQQVVALRGAGAANDNMTKSVGLARHEMINFSRQVQDVFVSLQAGQSPFTVLVQQGSQMADVLATSKGTIGGFFRQVGSWLGSILTPARLAVGGLAGIGIAGVTAAMQWGSAQRDIEVALLGIGRASGVTRADINAIAEASATAFGLSRSEARGFATELASTGKIGRESIADLVSIGKDVSRIFGVDAADAAKMLGKAYADPVRGAQELNARLGFLDAATQRNIANLVAQNRLYDAQRLLTDGVKSSLTGLNQTVSSATNFWTALGNSISNAWDKFGQWASRTTGIGLVRGIDEQIADAERRVADLEARMARTPGRVNQAGQLFGENQLAAEKTALDQLREARDRYNRSLEETRMRQESLAQAASIRQALPEVAEFDAVYNRMVAIQRIMQEVDRSGGEQSDKLAQLGISYQQLQDAVARTTGAFVAFKPAFDRALEAADLAIKSAAAVSAGQRASIASQQAYNSAMQQGYGEVRANTLAEKARIEVLTQAATAQREASRERELAARQAVDAASLDIKLIGQSVGEQYRLRAELQARQQVEQEAARNRTAVDEAHLARLNEQIAKTAQLKQLEAERSLTSDVQFERDQLFRSDIDQQIAQRLRSVYGDNYVRQMDGPIAAQMRLNDQLRETRDIATDAMKGFLSDLRNGKSAADALGTALGRISDRLTDKFLSNLVNGAIGGQGFNLNFTAANDNNSALGLPPARFEELVKTGIVGGFQDVFSSGRALDIRPQIAPAGSGVNVGQAAVGVAAAGGAAYNAYQSASPLAGALTGAASGAAIGSMILPGVGTAIGAAVGAIGGAIAGLFGQADAAKKKLEEAKAAWAAADGEFQKFIAVMHGTSRGNLVSALDDARATMQKFVEAAVAAGEIDAGREAQQAFNEYTVRTTQDFVRTWSSTIDALNSGLGPNSPFLQAANEVQTLAETLKGFVADTAYVNGAVGEAQAASQSYALSLLDVKDPISAVQQQVLALQGRAQALQPVLEQLGLSAGDAASAIASKLTVAIAKLNADAIADRVFSIRDWLFNQLNDTSTLAGQLAAFDRQAEEMRQNEIKAGGEVMAELESSLNQARYKIIQDWNDKILEEQKRAADEAISFWNGFSRRITEYLDGLRGGSQSPLSPQDRLTSAQSAYNTQLALAQSGNRDALNGITSYSDRYLEAAKAFYASSSGFQSIFEQVTGQLGALPAQVSDTTLLINAIEDTTSAITDMQSALVTVLNTGNLSSISAALLSYLPRIDTNTDGAISFAEMQSALGSNYSTGTLRSIFTELDNNGNGVLEKSDLTNTKLETGNTLTTTTNQLLSVLNHIDLALAQNTADTGLGTARLGSLAGMASDLLALKLMQREQNAQRYIPYPQSALAPLPTYSMGGLVSGPGSGTSDSILARISSGEYVMRSAAVDRYGIGMMDAINGMRVPMTPPALANDNGGFFAVVSELRELRRVTEALLRRNEQLERRLAEVTVAGAEHVREGVDAVGASIKESNRQQKLSAA